MSSEFMAVVEQFSANVNDYIPVGLQKLEYIKLGAAANNFNKPSSPYKDYELTLETDPEQDASRQKV